MRLAMEPIAQRMFKKRNPDRMDLVKWYNWFLYNRMNYDTFCTFYSPEIRTEYIDEKWKNFRVSPNSWYMDQPESSKERLIDLAIKEYAK